MSGNLEQALAELNLSPDVDTSVLEKLDMEFNLPERGMSSARISELQSETANGISDVLRFGVYDEEESIVESKEEAVDREVSIRSQLTIALRYLDQLLEIDSQVCGVSDALGEAGVGGIESTTGGIKMPMRNIKENGENITVEAKNSWGSDPDSKDRSKDMPILTRGDKVNFFDSKDRYIGSGEVKFAERGNIHLSAHSSVVFRKGCYIKKASNKGTLIRYKKKVAMFCRQMEHVPTDKMGIDYNLDLIEELKVKRVTRLRPYTGVLYEVDEEQIPELNVAESAFLGRGDNQYLGRNNLKSEDIPRSILGDPEQCAAFALGASGYPCFLIQGPSGTGKTTVASNIAKLNQSKGRRTLIVSHSNKGLDVLLGATKKIGAAVHRAGTHIESCRKDLREDFMRKGLKYPVKSEFISYEFDKESYDKACRGAEVGKKPYRETFTDVIFDEEDYDQAISDFKSRKKDIVDKLKEERGLIVGVTLTTLLTDEIIKELDFDTVIVDEASRGYIYELLPALEKAGKQIIFVGDHVQLGNIPLAPNVGNFLSDASQSEDVGNIGKTEVEDFQDGPFKFLAEKSSMYQVMLKTNRRSLPAIVEMISKMGYEGRLKAGRIDMKNPENIGELIWVDTSSRPDSVESSAGLSMISHLEARLIARRLCKDFEKGIISKENDSFGIIAMYSAQVRTVEDRVNEAKFDDLRDREEFIELLANKIATVDSFQGDEEDRIYISMTRSNENENVGHLNEKSRIIVAFSRSRDSVVIFGDKETLIDNNPDAESATCFEQAYKSCEEHGTVISDWPTLPVDVMPEEKKSKTHNAIRQRRRRRMKGDKKKIERNAQV